MRRTRYMCRSHWKPVPRTPVRRNKLPLILLTQQNGVVTVVRGCPCRNGQQNFY